MQRGRAPVAAIAIALAVPAASAGHALAADESHFDFDGDHGGLVDRNGVGTGFTHVSAPGGGGGYVPELLEQRDGALRVQTRAGIQWLGANSLVNGLGVPVPRGEVFTLQTTLLGPPAATRRYEQAGLWLGGDQRNYAKLVYSAPPTRQRLEFSVELGDERAALHRTVAPVARPRSVQLLLRRDTGAHRLGAWYAVDGGPWREFGSVRVPDDFGIHDPAHGRQSYAGVFATHRHATSPLVYRFDRFATACHSGCAAPRPEDPGPDPEDPGPGKIDLDESDAEGRGHDPGSPDAGHLPRSGTGGDGTSRFSARVRAPRRTSLAGLRRGIRISVTCSSACRARSQIGPVRGRSRSRAATRVTVRLVASPRASRLLSRRVWGVGRRGVRLRLRTVVTGPRAARVRTSQLVVVTL